MKLKDYQKNIEGYAIRALAIKENTFTFYLEEDKDHSSGKNDVKGRLAIYYTDKTPEESWKLGTYTNMLKIHGAWAKKPEEKLVSVTLHGRVWTAGGGQNDRESSLENLYEIPGLHNVRCISKGKVYAAGGNRSIFRRDDHEKWVRLEEGLTFRKRGGKQKKAAPYFKDVDGFNDDDLYVCGDGGDLWHWSKDSWRPLDPPVNKVLTSICCASDGFVYVVGLQGVILRGKEDQWEQIEQNLDDSGFLAVRWFKGKIYITSWYGLYTLKGDSLIRVNVLPAILNDYGHLESNEDYLLVAGPYTAASFDGKKWRNIINEGLDLDDLQDLQEIINNS